MKRLSDLYDIDSDVEVTGISMNSKEVKKGDIFVCTMGVTADRHDFVDDAIKNGAVALVVSRDVGEKTVPIVKVDDTNYEFPRLCQRFYDYPDKDMKIIGITGTDGKTSLALIVQALIGIKKCAYIGTNGAICEGVHDHLINTTPDADILYKYMDIFRNKGCEYLSIETSSEAFYRERLQTFEFEVGVYTNISPEHMNIHKTFDHYLNSKLQLFRQVKDNGYCIINRDEEHYEQVKENSNGKILTYGFYEESDLRIIDYKLFLDHTLITFKYDDKEFKVNSPLLAVFNIYNLAASLLVGLVEGFELDELIDNIKNIEIEGRMDVLDTKTPYTIIIDFAHTPHSIEAILQFAEELEHNKIITVIGSAGGRDSEKRPIIGNVCGKYSDITIFTTDDPRSEDPKEICKQMASELDDKVNYEIIVDRGKAIDRAVALAEENDLILLLCKGNEPYQITDKGYEPYDEYEEAYRAVKESK